MKKEKEEDRQSRFVWEEGDVLLYDQDGHRLDPATGKPVSTGDDPESAKIRRMVRKFRETH